MAQTIFMPKMNTHCSGAEAITVWWMCPSIQVPLGMSITTLNPTQTGPFCSIQLLVASTRSVIAFGHVAAVVLHSQKRKILNRVPTYPEQLLNGCVNWFLVIMTLKATLHPLTHQGWRNLDRTLGRVNNCDNNCKQYQKAVAITTIHKQNINFSQGTQNLA